MHTYTVISCSYDGTSGGGNPNPNPLCFLTGTVDGRQTYAIPVFYDTIMQANAVGGQSAVQSALAPILLSAITTPLDGHTIPGAPFTQGPVFTANVAPAAPGSNSVSVPAALVAPWSQ